MVLFLRASGAQKAEFTKNTPKDKSYPETGGSGTAVYYVAGAILLLVAAGLLIGKRRMGKKN